MDEFCRYAHRPIAFLVRYIARRPICHGAILIAVLAAVCCAVSTQYGVKILVDTLSAGDATHAAWLAFALLVSLIVADNLLWRVASWIGSYTFAGVTGDLRCDLFRHLTGHAPSYFADRLPGTLSSRITATSNAVFTIENMFVWNVLPPCVATFVSVAWVATVSLPMAAGLCAIAGLLVFAMFRLAAAGRRYHHDFADKAAAVDGQMIDIIGNIPVVWAFGGLFREHRRFAATVEREVTTRRRSLYYLEMVRSLHAVVTLMLTIALFAWAIMLWERGAATTGDVVLVTTLGLGILHATRDLALALVDVTQHMARFSEALETLLVPHTLRDHPEATPLARTDASIVFENVAFTYPDGRQVFENLNLSLQRGQRHGLVGPSGAGKSTIFALLQRFYDVESGRILINGEDICRVTQQSLRDVIAVVPQDISMFHRSILENVRYGRVDASDAEVLEAMEAARCNDFVDDLPNGIHTIVGERGVKLSGGQRQRIAIARAFLRDAPILLLDEATSALDSESEEAIRDALDHLMRGRTVVAIAHRLSTLRNFDRIVVLQDGEVHQDGPPDHLMRRPGLYRELVQREVTRLAKHAA
jgi:ATP-binding cassette, subfamily B, bacterial